jgi:putative ABC transport system ATP-binding protein
MATREEVVRLEKVSKIYREGDIEIPALREVDFVLHRGEFTALVGPSGSGKTTLLNLISGLDVPTSGRVILAGRDISRLSGGELATFRRDHIGFIFQSYNLIPVLTVEENVEYVLLLQGVPSRERKRRVREVLRDVGLEGFEKRYPPQLSGGQQQRVAIARAMVHRPDIVLADEPTANLDTETGRTLLKMMKELNRSRGITFLFSTHDPMIMEEARRLVFMRDGRIEREES